MIIKIGNMKLLKQINFSFIILGFLLNLNNIALGQGNIERKYTLAEKNIKHAEADLPLKLNSSFTRAFKVVFSGQEGKIKVRCEGKTMKKKDLNIKASEVTFTAMPGKTYVISK